MPAKDSQSGRVKRNARLKLAAAVWVVLSGVVVASNSARAQEIAPLTHGSRSVRSVCLTFDACQTHVKTGFDAKIVAILMKRHIPATFMLGGYWMETHPDATRLLASDPQFELGNHSYLHPHMTKLDHARMAAEMESTQADLVRIAGRHGVLFRPPYGEWNPELLQTASQLGLKTITWEVVSGDPDKMQTARDIVDVVLRKARPGSIVIMHVNGRGWHTAEALPAVIAGLQKRGFGFETVSDALAR
jgi:peptidoglycan/xylan/chitin deacetylase (PgdA/CDA1 family)